MSGFSVKGLSPEAWEAYKWHLRIKNLSPFFDDIVLKDDKIKNGHYDRGEAYIRKDEKDLPLTGKELKEFEEELGKVGENYFQIFVEDGKALKAIVEGKCLREGYRYVDCTQREISDATRKIGPSHFTIYADPLRRASDENPTNPDIALIAGRALFDNKKHAESIPYFTRANAYVNDSTALDYLVKVAFEVGDWAQFKKLLADNRISHDTVLEFVLKNGEDAIIKNDFVTLLKTTYALKLFEIYQGANESFVAWAKALPNDASLQTMLKKYPEDFQAQVLAAKKMKGNDHAQKRPAPAKPAPKQAQDVASGDYLFK